MTLTERRRVRISAEADGKRFTIWADSLNNAESQAQHLMSDNSYENAEIHEL